MKQFLIYCSCLVLLMSFGCKKTTAITKTPTKLDGKALVVSKTCTVCHTLDGKKLIGPTFKGIFGRKTTVLTDGKEHVVTVDEAYIKRSVTTPNADTTKGFPKGGMVLGVKPTPAELDAIIAYLKTLK